MDSSKEVIIHPRDGALLGANINLPFGITQNQEYRQIRALIKDDPKDTNTKIAAKLMYDEIRKNAGKIIEESDLDGLISL